MAKHVPKVKPFAQVIANGKIAFLTSSGLEGHVLHPKDAPNAIGEYCAPDDIGLAENATRLHELIHLHLVTTGFQEAGIGRAFYTAQVPVGWFQAIGDAKVMHFCLKAGFEKEIKHLCFGEETTLRRIVKHQQTAARAALYLRSLGTKSEKLIEELTALKDTDKAFILSQFLKINEAKTAAEWLVIGKALQERFEKQKKQGKKESTEGESKEESGVVHKERERIARKYKIQVNKDFQKPKTTEITEEEEEGENTLRRMSKDVQEKVKEVEEFADLFDSGVFSIKRRDVNQIAEQLTSEANSLTPVQWGTMDIVSLQLTRAVQLKRKVKSIRPGFVGALRYPHRMQTDGMVFGLKQFVQGGTLLIDCSSSMGLSAEDIETVLDDRPHATIALYSGLTETRNRGKLVIIARAGRQIDTTKLRECMELHTGPLNVIDGPALRWLARQTGEKFWICDGQVTGEGDSQVLSLTIEAALLQARNKIKRYNTIKCFRNGRQAGLRPPQ